MFKKILFEREFLDSYLRFPNVIRKRYELIFRMFIKRLPQPCIGTLRACFWRTFFFFLNKVFNYKSSIKMCPTFSICIARNRTIVSKQRHSRSLIHRTWSFLSVSPVPEMRTCTAIYRSKHRLLRAQRQTNVTIYIAGGECDAILFKTKAFTAYRRTSVAPALHRPFVIHLNTGHAFSDCNGSRFKTDYVIIRDDF